MFECSNFDSIYSQMCEPALNERNGKLCFFWMEKLKKGKTEKNDEKSDRPMTLYRVYHHIIYRIHIIIFTHWKLEQLSIISVIRGMKKQPNLPVVILVYTGNAMQCNAMKWLTQCFSN